MLRGEQTHPETAHAWRVSPNSLCECLVAGSANAFCFLVARTKRRGWVLPVNSLADDLLNLDAAQGFDAVGHQMQELLSLYVFHLATFHIGENESRHLVGDFKLRFAGNLDIDFFSHFAPPLVVVGKPQSMGKPIGKRMAQSSPT